MTYDYKAVFIDAVDDLIAENIADRSERMKAVDALITAYIDDVGERPDSAQLERLTDYILREELTDTDRRKSANSEYPILSEIQLARRREGKHQRKETASGEAPMKHAEEYASDGRNYRTPIRRIRSIAELIFVDENAKIRNKERAAQYRKDTAPGPVIPHRTAEFTECRRIKYRVIPEYYRS